MQRMTWKLTGLTIALSAVLVWSVTAQQPQHHRGGAQTPTEQPAGGGASEQPQMMEGMQGMMEGMQGMMEGMQGMMEHMQGMMGRGGMLARGGMMGMMGRGGMMADDDDDMPMGMMMRRHGMMGGMPGHSGRFMRHVDRLLDQLGLTGEQETKVRSMVRGHMQQAIRAHADIEVKRLDLRDLLDAEPVDLAKVKTLLQSMAAQRVELHVAHIAMMQEVRGLLTPEQHEKFRSMRRQMMRGESGMMGGERGMMGRGGMHGQSGMRNPCGMMGRGPRNQ